MSTLSFTDVPVEYNRRKQIEKGIREALKLLLEKDSLPKIEDSYKDGKSGNNLNRELNDCFRQVCGSCGIETPRFNAPNPRYYKDVDRHLRENQIPDFHWELIDHINESGVWRFVLECKRLGSNNPNWNLNQNYVDNGMFRFISSPHEYGKGDSESGMIAYVQGMDFDDILDEINRHIARLPQITSAIPRPASDWTVNGISEMSHDLQREFPLNVFTLFHYWIDVRRHFT
jgi:hypothetical protein